MFRKASARTKTILNACIDKRLEDEGDNADDIIEGSPLSNQAELCSERDKTFAHEDLSSDTALICCDTQNITATPSLLRAKLLLGLDKSQAHVPEIYNATNIEEEAGEKSLEPPPFSPLTPKVPCLPDQNITMPDSLSSPLRPMTPETTQLFHMLADNFDVCENIDNFDNENLPASPALSNKTENFNNSDDSVLDPDYACNDNTFMSSDNGSGESVSLITTSAEVYQMTDESVQGTSTAQTNTAAPGRPKKGRKRNNEYTRQEMKKRKYTNLPYVNSRKQKVDPKPFLEYKCSCKKNCSELISLEKRLVEFKKFYALGSYDAQNMYLAACVKELAVKRQYVTKNPPKKKTFTRQYYLKGIHVCKEMFLKTLQTTSKRVNTSLSKMRSDNCILDKRGKQAGNNRVPSECENFLINIIKKLPTYISHYRRASCNDAKFLRSDMTFPKIYELYSNEAILAGQRLLSYTKAKHVFVTKFNLRTKPLKKDTCNKCDYFVSQKKSDREENNSSIEEKHNEHLQKANFLQSQLRNDMKLAKEDHFTETITFDLQKTLPLPRIPTNVVFYKRQLWVYNLGIHSGSDDQAYCNIWVEGEAGRGAQEVGSCLIRHLTEKLGDDVKHLILWSDSCGGQNRNIKVALMLKAFLNDHPKLEKISHRFLESGHSFLPNDTDFGRIECALKHQQRLYLPSDYMNIMEKCKQNKPMHVRRMNKDDFWSSEKLERRITNRKKAVDGSKVSWLDTKEILIKKGDFSLFMRSDLDDDFVEIDLKKNGRGQNNSFLRKDMMDPLWPSGKPIPQAKLNDLHSLLHLIPQDAHEFYKGLLGSALVVDDIDGFSGRMDFGVEIDDE